MGVRAGAELRRGDEATQYPHGPSVLLNPGITGVYSVGLVLGRGEGKHNACPCSCHSMPGNNSSEAVIRLTIYGATH